jgi:starvation-inducible outer membrane lipoprotein
LEVEENRSYNYSFPEINDENPGRCYLEMEPFYEFMVIEGQNITFLGNLINF